MNILNVVSRIIHTPNVIYVFNMHFKDFTLNVIDVILNIELVVTNVFVLDFKVLKRTFK